MNSFVELRNVWKVYRTGGSETGALRGVDLEVDKGSFIAVVGPSGSGKSTLLHIIGGLDRPTRGFVRVDNLRLDKLSSDRELSMYRNRMVGFVFQMFYLIPRLSALQNVELPLISRDLPPDKRRKLAMEALRLVGLENKAYNKPTQLSGGEQQRVAIARAIVGKPKLLLADEPTGNLDTTNAEIIMKLFRDLNRELEMTIILVTHNLELIWYCDKVYRMVDGRIVKMYSPNEYDTLIRTFIKRR